MASKKTTKQLYSAKTCRGIQDLMEIISGKWKLLILITLIEKPYKFKELCRKLHISPRMLTRELQDMEMNKLITRTVCNTKPITVEYAITPIGLTLKKVIDPMGVWGIWYRKKMSARNGKDANPK
ncbi:MAG TPA: helix-turn-helix domain-containing protein [Bacteroidia bacterium]|nr:helix-turn-helix domain-containing protein [Bacteroidia bacterium]